MKMLKVTLAALAMMSVMTTAVYANNPYAATLQMKIYNNLNGSVETQMATNNMMPEQQPTHIQAHANAQFSATGYRSGDAYVRVTVQAADGQCVFAKDMRHNSVLSQSGNVTCKVTAHHHFKIDPISAS